MISKFGGKKLFGEKEMRRKGRKIEQTGWHTRR